ncbi:MAG TPA: lysoplasmalogenase [Acidimicrobiia bacterium]|nr:lysoplasmalogenase [Acidimicrobiia bacterium]
MTDIAGVLLGVAVACAAGDWVAVAISSTRLEYLFKPAATAALVGVAATIDAAHGDTRAWFVAGLVLCLAGDVFLMLPARQDRSDAFVPGLGSFLLAQLAFTVGFSLHGGSTGEYVLGGVLVTAAAGPLAVRFIRALLRSRRATLVGPVVAYLLAIAAMATAAIGAANAWGITGAVLFLASDSLIAETRFVAERRGVPVAIMVTYHLALVGLVVSLI